MTRIILCALCLSAVAAGLAASGSATPSRTDCTPGVIGFGGVQARVFCGPATATLHIGGKTLSFKNGNCSRTSKYVSVNIGTVVLGQTSKKKPDYFGLDVGQIPGSIGKPAPTDGTYTGGTIAVAYGGKSYDVRGDTAKITLSGNRSKGTISGSLLFGGSGPVTGAFTC